MLEQDQQVLKFDSTFGKNLQTDQVHQVPETFFCHDQGPPLALVRIVLDKIRAIRDVFEVQRKYKIYASSLLLTYDAKAVRQFKSSAVQDEDKLRKFVNIRLIDFAHVFDAHGQRDDNFLRGINNLIELFDSYLKRLALENQS